MDLVRDGASWGKDLLNEFVSGVMDRVEWAKGKIASAADAVTSNLSFDIEANDRMAREWGADAITEFVSGASQASQEQNVPLPTEMGAGGGFRAKRERQPTIIMDGRELTKQDGRFRDDQTSRRATDG
jgi:hypothetical protein